MVKPMPPQALAKAAKSMGSKSQPYSGFSRKHLLPFNLTQGVV